MSVLQAHHADSVRSLECVLSHIPTYDVFCFASVCRVFAAAAKTVSPIATSPRGIFSSVERMLWCYRCTELHSVWSFRDIVSFAIDYDSMDVLQWAHIQWKLIKSSQWDQWDPSDQMYVATMAFIGRFDMLKFAVSTGLCVFQDDRFHLFGDHDGRTQILEWLLSKQYRVHQQYVTSLASDGDLKTLMELKDCIAHMAIAVAWEASEKGHTDILKWLTQWKEHRDYDVTISPLCLKKARANNHTETVEWLESQLLK